MSRLPAKPEELAAALLAWYRRAARELPWRGQRDPYAIWVSEVMLQQTQVATVLRYYGRFLRDFPTVEALAAAELPEVLARWSGLGYYRRARALHAAAREIVRRGAFPATLEGLRELPGFGPYTAAAVGSIAFGLPEPAIDGNAVRVYARLVGLRAPRAEAEKTLRAMVRPLLEAGPPSEINQAIMDLGASLCARQAPACLLCPWRGPCRARRSGAQAEIPPVTARPPRRALSWAAAVVRDRQGRLLFARRPEKGLFAGLWELPGGEPRAREPMPAALARLLLRSLGLRARVGPELGSISQQLTHRDLEIVAFETRASGRPVARGYLDVCFASEVEARELALSSATRKLLTALRPAAASPRR
ncbi:MAG: A/G-specific adenine glycosylase [Myxococcales bacterium]